MALNVALTRRMLDVNITGSLICAKHAIKRMAKRNGGNGGVIVNLSGLGLTFSDIGGGTLQTSGQGLAFPDGNESDLIAGNCYVNVHTTTNPPGEIRGQIVTP